MAWPMFADLPGDPNSSRVSQGVIGTMTPPRFFARHYPPAIQSIAKIKANQQSGDSPRKFSL
jgi:hypothetical protein